MHRQHNQKRKRIGYSGNQHVLLSRDQTRSLPRTGKKDYLASRDIEDFIAVVDGRSSLRPEMERTSPALKVYIADAARTVLEKIRFPRRIAGVCSTGRWDQARIGQFFAKLPRLEAIG